MIDATRLTAGGRLTIRAARAGDRAFARTLYLAMGRAVLRPAADSDLDWLRERFDVVYKRRESWILCDGPEAAGWVQIEDGDSRVTLHQMHLLPPYRDSGIGEAIVRELQRQAGHEGKPVHLRVLKGNPAQALYARLGFEVTGEDERRYHMRWQPDADERPAGPA
jgi:ribosomal protein S18 acetylase RimI-like enzyme